MMRLPYLAFLLVCGAQTLHAHGLIRSHDSDGDGALDAKELAAWRLP